MKKIIVLTMLLAFVLTGCGQENTETEVLDSPSDVIEELVSEPIEESNIEESAEVVDTVSKENKIIYPLKSGIDIENIDDVMIHADFDLTAFDFENKTLKMEFYEQDIYDAIDITTMKIGDSIIINDETFPIEEVSENDGFIDINGGYTTSEYGMTFMSNDGGTFRTILLDDYGTYSKLGETVLPIAKDFELIDYTRGDYGDEGIKTDLEGLNDFIANLPDWDMGFGYHNTEVRIVNNQIVQVIRHWVP